MDSPPPISRMLSLLATTAALLVAANVRAQCLLNEVDVLLPDALEHDALILAGDFNLVAMSGEWAILGQPEDDADGVDTGSAYVFHRHEGRWSRVAKLTPSQPVSFFGWSVSIASASKSDGGVATHDLAVVTNGSLGGGDVAHVFGHAVGAPVDQWTQLAELSAPAPVTFYAVALAGDRALLGARDDGVAWVFAHEFRDPGSWMPVAELTPPDGGAGTSFGRAVALDGDHAVVGAADSACVFRREEGEPERWTPVATLIPPPAIQEQGPSVAIDGETALVGRSGAVLVFERHHGGADRWGEAASLAPCATSTHDPDHERFGESVSLDGRVALVGASQRGIGAGPDRAVAFVRRDDDPGRWDAVARLEIPDPAARDFGETVVVDGGFALVVPERYLDESSAEGDVPAYFFDLRDRDGSGHPDLCLPLDCNGNGIADFEDVAAGTANDCNCDALLDECDEEIDDCNANGVPDECDLASGVSFDCDGNLVPDECEQPIFDCNDNGLPDHCDLLDRGSDDCNGNLVPDECDIAGGFSDDANGDGIPDECQLADVNGDGAVDVLDLIVVILAWGTADPAADLNGDGTVGVADLTIVILNWSA